MVKTFSSIARAIFGVVTTLKRQGVLWAFHRLYELFREHGFVYTIKKAAKYLKKIRGGGFALSEMSYEALRDHANESARVFCRKSASEILIVVPSYNDREVLEQCIRSIEQYRSELKFRVVICDDNSPTEHKQWLKQIENKLDWLSVRYGDKNAGFAGNVNRGLAAAREYEHVVLLNSDTIVTDYWLDNLHYVANQTRSDIVCGKLVYPSGEIQYFGGMRNPYESDWFMHDHHMGPMRSSTTCFPQYTLYATGACMYVTSRALKMLGPLDEKYEMAFEDVDYSLRAWSNGLKVGLAPFSVVTHMESVTRGRVQGARELRSKAYFWEKNANFFKRNVMSPKTGTPKVIYVTQDCGIGGGHRFIFQHLKVLHQSNFDVELWTLGAKPDWFGLDQNIPFRSFGDYEELTRKLATEDAIKVATWWETAEHVWLASVTKGLPVYYVQDIESSYYIRRKDFVTAAKVESMYKPEFKYITYAKWIKDKIESDFKREATCVGFYLDQNKFGRIENTQRKRQILIFARNEPLKNFEYTKKILSEMRSQGSEYSVIAVGPDPSLVDDMENCTFIRSPSDSELNLIYNQSLAVIQTSVHEGLSLPPLEGMLCGCLIFTTDAYGNRAYIKPNINCILLPDNDVNESAKVIMSGLSDLECGNLDAMLNTALSTAKEYNYNNLADNLLGFYSHVSITEYGCN